MAPNKRKILEAARKYAQKGQREKALKEYAKLVKADPRDAKLRLEIGDAHRRWGQTDEAVAAYSKVAEQYMSEGFDARAVAVFKQIQNLVPDRYETYTPLSELYQRMGLTAEAIQTLQAAADGFHREGRKRDALELLRKMAALDPSNTTSRIKVADLLRQEGMDGEAFAEYQAARAELERQGEAEAAETVLKRMLEIDPDRVEILVALVENLVQRGQTERAEPFAKHALEKDPDEPAHYERLAAVYLAQNRDEDHAQTYRDLAEVHRRRGDEDQARQILQRFAAVGAIGSQEESPFGAAGEPLLDDEELLGEDLVVNEGAAPALETDDEAVIELTDEPVVGDAGSERPELEVDDDFEEEIEPVTGDPDQLLAEASVYLRYGKRAQALRNLEGILVQEPEHRGALEKLGEAHADAGDTEQAVAAWLRAAERARSDGDAEGLGVLRDRIGALDAEAAAGIEIPEPAPAEPRKTPPTRELEISAEGGADEDGELDDDLEIEIEDELDLEGDAPAQEEGGEAEEAGPSVSLSARISGELEEADFYRQQGLLDEARAIYERILEQAPNHPTAMVRLGEITAAGGKEPSAAGSEASDSETPVAVDVGTGIGDWDDPEALDLESAPDAGGGDLDVVPPATDLDLDDVEIEDAGDDDEPDGSGDTTGVEGVEAGPGAPAPAAGAGFDLAAELSEALDENEASVTGAAAGISEDDVFASVFSEFKKGVSRTLGEGDHEAHYDLGIAYREMGLLDDAVGEFRQSMKSPARRVASLHMLGLCCLELDRAEEAVAHLEAALGTEGLGEDESLAVRFELGRAFESLGEVGKAEEAWRAVAAVDPDFCEVEARLAALGEKGGDAAPAAAGLESFDDLFDDVEDAEPVGDDEPAPEAKEVFDELIAEANEDADEPEPEPEPEPKRPRRRKKRISFV